MKCKIEEENGCFKCPYPDCTFDERNAARKKASYYMRHKEERKAYQRQYDMEHQRKHRRKKTG